MADDSDEGEEFEDAVEVQPMPTTMDLEASISETQIALNLFLNNKFEQAKERMEPWSKSSMYHALGYSTILHIQAMMTFEAKAIEDAMQALKTSCALCHQHRKQFSLSGQVSKIVRSPVVQVYTDEQMHAELCYAECLMGRALLTFVQDESLVSFVKGALKVRNCYQSFKECQRILHEHSWGSRDERLRAHFESGVRVGIGVFNLFISILPPRIIKLMEFAGFSGNKELGLSQLATAAGMLHTIRSPLASLMLLSYQMVGTYLFGMGDCDLQLCDRLMAPLLKNYPKGALILYNAGRLCEIKGQIYDALTFLNESISAQTDWKQFHHLCYWEMMFCHAFIRDWRSCAAYSMRLYDESRWSPSTYAYLSAMFLYCQQLSNLTREERDKMTGLFEKVPSLKQRIAGKSIPVEKFCINKAQRYFKKSESLFLPQYELLYLWNGFKIIGQNAELVKPIFDEVEAAAQLDLDPDDKCLCLLLKAMCLKHLQSPFQAQQCLLSILPFEKELTDNFYVYPNALLELALLLLEEDRVLEAKKHIISARECKSYLLESRLHFRLHAVNDIFQMAHS